MKILGKEFIIICPRCGARNIVNLDKFSPEFGGLRRIALIHKDHALIVDIDSSLFMRGAYITPYTHIVGTATIFRDYTVLTDIIIVKNFEFIACWPTKKIIDIRTCPECLTDLYNILSLIVRNLQPQIAKEKINSPETISMDDKHFIVIRNSYVVLFGLVPSPSNNENRVLWFKAICGLLGDSPLPTNVLRELAEYTVERINRRPNKQDILELQKISGKSNS